MRILFLHILSLILIQPVFSQENPDPPVKEKVPRKIFVDLDGDGFNDLLPDLDRDGIPDEIDPTIREPGGPWRAAWFRSMPDSVRSDTVRFKNWMQKTHPKIAWRQAWIRWMEHRQLIENQIHRRMMQRHHQNLRLQDHQEEQRRRLREWKKRQQKKRRRHHPPG